jgi:hypothetical protein
VEVTWVRPFRPRSIFASLRDAYLAVNLSVAKASADDTRKEIALT